MSADGLTADERAAYQAMVARGYSEQEAYEDALDGVHADDVRDRPRPAGRPRRVG